MNQAPDSLKIESKASTIRVRRINNFKPNISEMKQQVKL